MQQDEQTISIYYKKESKNHVSKLWQDDKPEAERN